MFYEEKMVDNIKINNGNAAIMQKGLSYIF